MADKVMDALNAIASNVESLQVKAGLLTAQLIRTERLSQWWLP
jgi:hypothetical protein